MKKKSIIFVLLCGYLLPHAVYSQGSAQTMTLTLKEVRVSNNPSFSFQAFRMIDENENVITFTGNPDNWFENATIQGVIIPLGIPMKEVRDEATGAFHTVIADEVKLLFNFYVNGSIHSIGVGAGSKFVVRKTNAGRYNLLAEETAKLSPPPAEEK